MTSSSDEVLLASQDSSSRTVPCKGPSAKIPEGQMEATSLEI